MPAEGRLHRKHPRMAKLFGVRNAELTADR